MHQENLLTAGRKVVTFPLPRDNQELPPRNKRSLMEVDCDEFGTNPGDDLDSFASGCGAEMASQQKLGLWTKRGHRSDFGDHPDSPLVGENLDKPPNARRRICDRATTTAGGGRSSEFIYEAVVGVKWF